MMRPSSTGRLLLLLALLFSAVSVSALDVPLTVTNREPVARSLEPVTGGVPFARGALRDARNLRLLLGGKEIAAQFLATAEWPDDSIRWVLVDTAVDLPASGVVSLSLQTGTPQTSSGISVTEDTATITVDTGASRQTFQRDEFSVRGNSLTVRSSDQTYRAVPRSWTVEESGPMKVVLRADGVFTGTGLLMDSDRVGFRARLTFHRNRSETRVALTLRNRSTFNWQGSGTRGPAVTLGGATFGVPLLPQSGENHVLGQGVEKTWELRVPAEGTPELRETRFQADGSLAPGHTPMPPLLVATPSYYASARAWGALALPVTGAGDRQSDFDRYEKQQLAKVSAAAVENLPNASGHTIWTSLATDLARWNDYGDLRWAGNGCGNLSGNHYDWPYGMWLQFMRSGRLEFADAARVFARHEIDFDIYHTADDGPAFNFQKNWEDRPSHDSPDNCFGPGRPTHTWTQGYALHWLVTGDRRGLDAFNELQEGIRQYLYEGFVDEGHVNTDEIRTNGWIVDNLVARWRIEPHASIATSSYGQKTIPQAIRDVLQNVFERETAAGGRGFVYGSRGDEVPDPNLRAPLQIAYFVEPAVKACDEVFRDSDSAYAASLLGLLRRMSGFLMSITYGGDSNSSGMYRPRQIPYFFDVTQPVEAQQQGQIPYLLMAANVAGFLHTETHDAQYRDYAQAAFSDYVRYWGAIPGDTYSDPSLRTPAAYNSAVFTETESKIQGWSARYGQYYLAAESAAPDQAQPHRRRAVRH